MTKNVPPRTSQSKKTAARKSRKSAKKKPTKKKPKTTKPGSVSPETPSVISVLPANKQIATLKAIRLKQRAAAWVIKTPISTLRDNPAGCPPDETGSYSIDDLVSFLKAEIDSDSESPVARKRLLENRRLENQVRDSDAKYFQSTGRLVDRELVVNQLLTAVQAFKNVGDKFARKKNIKGEQAQLMLNQAIDRLAEAAERLAE